MEKPEDVVRDESFRAIVGKTRRTGLHPKRSTNAEHRDKEDDGNEAEQSWLVSRIAHCAHDHE